MPHRSAARVVIALVVLSGAVVFGNALLHGGSRNCLRLLSCALVTCLAATLKVKLPGITGTMSMNLPFILVAVAELNAAEALVVGCLSTLAQCLPRGQHGFHWIQVLFNVANM